MVEPSEFRMDGSGDEPSDEELTAIERESGLLAAELALLDAELAILTGDGDLSDVDLQRLRRAMRDVLAESAALYRDDEPDDEFDGDALDDAEDGDDWDWPEDDAA